MKFVKFSVHVFDICWKSSGLLIQKLQVRISWEATFCIVCFDKHKLGFRTLPFQLKRRKLSSSAVEGNALSVTPIFSY